MWQGRRRNRNWFDVTLIAALLAAAPVAAQYPGMAPSRIPPAGVPETPEPPLANPNELPKSSLPSTSTAPHLNSPLLASPPASRTSTPSAATAADPPTPVVSIRVRAPAAISVGAA